MYLSVLKSGRNTESKNFSNHRIIELTASKPKINKLIIIYIYKILAIGKYKK